MKIQKIKSTLTVANNAESRLYRAENRLLKECQDCCEYPLDFCEYQSGDGFCLGYRTDEFDNNLISVNTFIELVRKSTRRLKLEDLQGTF